MRRFVCPFCNFVHHFSPKEAQKYKKKVIGFTCPNCGRKPTQADLAKTRGAGPKPKSERRKRVKKEVIKDTSPIVVHPHVEQFEWRTRDEVSHEKSQRRGVRTGWKPKPATRTLEEVLVEGHLSKKTKKVK